MKKAIYIAVIVLLLIVFGVSAFMVGSYFLEGREQADKFDDLAQMRQEAKDSVSVPTDAADDEEPEETTEPIQIRDENGMLIEYAGIYELNSDLVGWIRIDGTVIDYPVMQTSMDNKDFYLKRNFDKEYSDRGCIYIREECDMEEPSDNITIYGHNMMDGSMFAYLGNYIDQAEWEKNPLIFFDTLTDYHVYKIFAVFKTTASLGEGFTYHQFVDAESEEDFDEFISTIKSLDFYDTGITPEYGDKIICLSTCEYTQENGRLVVAAYRIS